MKTIILYQCEVCNRQYTNDDSAKTCEAREPAPVYPIGMIFGDHTPGDMYSDITFAIAENHVQEHYNNRSLWACRDTKHGDSLGTQMCGGASLAPLFEHDAKLNPDTPHFKRMVAWLQSQGTPVTVWNGDKPVPLDEWLKSRKP